LNKIVDILAGIVVVAGIMVLVRPGSQGPALANALGNAYIGGLVTATGSGVPAGYTSTPWAN
jgi:hypothetical protein